MTEQTVTLVHHSTGGRLHINGVGEVDPETPFEVSAALGASLLQQTDLYSQVKSKGESA